jgi:hypothetical protein
MISFLENYNMFTAAGVDSSHIGQSEGPHEAASGVVVFKTEFVDIDSIRLVELTGCRTFARSINGASRRAVYGLEVPCLGLTIVGKLDISWSPLRWRKGGVNRFWLGRHSR